MNWSTVRVVVTEYERGWEQKIIGRHEFKTQEEADKFIKSINDKLTGPVPDYYIKADIVG